MIGKDTPRERLSFRAQRLLFQKRKQDALAGRHLPTTMELLQGMELMSGSLETDICEYANRMLRVVRWTPKTQSIRKAVPALQALANSPTIDQIIGLEKAFAEISSEFERGVNRHRLRCLIYRAHMGNPAAMTELAIQGMFAADSLSLGGLFQIGEVAKTALGWALASCQIRPFENLSELSALNVLGQSARDTMLWFRNDPMGLFEIYCQFNNVELQSDNVSVTAPGGRDPSRSL